MSESRKKATKDKLTASAVELFSENWYEAVSVAEICRNGNLSNGVFYRYFKDKEELFKQILDGFLDVIAGRFLKISGSSTRDRLVSFFGFVLESNRNDLPYIAIFREGEFRFPEYEQRLRNIYLEALKRVYKRKVSLAEYLYIIGSIRFLLRRPCFKSAIVTAEYLADLIYNGLFMEQPIDFSCLDIAPPQALDNTDEADTKTKLILSGRKLIAENNFYKVNIYEITKNAGFAVGTFYLHFSSKEELFSEIVLYLGRQLRYYISSNLDKNLSRVEKELQGWVLFLRYFETHQQNYELVREAEFVIRDTAVRYYNRIEKGYIYDRSVMRMNDSNDPLAERDIVANFLMGIAHFLGIEFFFSGNITDPGALIRELAIPLCKGIKE